MPRDARPAGRLKTSSRATSNPMSKLVGAQSRSMFQKPTSIAQYKKKQKAAGRSFLSRVKDHAREIETAIEDTGKMAGHFAQALEVPVTMAAAYNPAFTPLAVGIDAIAELDKAIENTATAAAAGKDAYEVLRTGPGKKQKAEGFSVTPSVNLTTMEDIHTVAAQTHAAMGPFFHDDNSL
ncbi:MAG: hypothetical protein QKV57_gp2 [Avonheates virus SG_4_10]|uniref:hypothetical protein n=1 Tax=Avonheates virus SG_4_10 TaxID=2914486 RepID=UPI002481EBDD|nr:MAG: hypothetical protein QKV57_gp2 [Avonheates virus SG_4_10]UNI72603.1 MAG: hypothetical protein [Avonheates virus SG_4_10]